MLTTLPINSDWLAYEVEVELDELSYRFELTWLERPNTWVASLYTEDGSPLALGHPVQSGLLLFDGIPDARAPKGTLFVVDTSGAQLDPGPSDLGTRVQVTYLPAGGVL